MADVNWLDEQEQTAWRSVVIGANRLLAQLDADGRTRGLAADDYAVLVSLSEAPDERLRMSDLADSVAESRSRLSHHIARMEQRGLVRRAACPEDRRGSWAVLTAEGRETIERVAPHHVAAVRRFFLDHVSPEELRVVATVFARVDAACRPGGGTAGDDTCGQPSTAPAAPA